MRSVMGDWFHVEPGGNQPDAVAFRDRRGQFHWFEPSTEKLHSAVWLTHAFADPEHRRSLGIQFESISRPRARELVGQRVGEGRAANYLQAVANDRFALEVAPRLAPGAREIFPRPRARAFADREQPPSILVTLSRARSFSLMITTCLRTFSEKKASNCGTSWPSARSFTQTRSRSIGFARTAGGSLRISTTRTTSNLCWRRLIQTLWTAGRSSGSPALRSRAAGLSAAAMSRSSGRAER